MKRYLPLVVFVILTAAAAAIGAQFEPGSWYASLNKPQWNPPNAVFGPVWSFLYLLIAIAGWRVWLERPQPWAQSALRLWLLQLVLNTLWSWLFFGLHQPLWALIDIVALLATIIFFIVKAWPRNQPAAWLFVPYALWVAFATALNAAIFWMNR